MLSQRDNSQHKPRAVESKPRAVRAVNAVRLEALQALTPARLELVITLGDKNKKLSADESSLKRWIMGKRKAHAHPTKGTGCSAISAHEVEVLTKLDSRLLPIARAKDCVGLEMIAQSSEHKQQHKKRKKLSPTDQSAPKAQQQTD